jgi:hypothetical protein
MILPMKKLLLPLIALALVFSSCDKDKDDDTPKGIVVKKEQWAFAINYTATWCAPCGSSGAPVIKKVGAMPRVLAITAHASNDPMYVQPLYSAFSSERTTGGGIPSFWVNDQKTTTSSTEGAVQTALSLLPSAALGMEATREGAVYKVKVKGEWYTAGTGEYYLSVLLLEDGIDGSASAGTYKQNGTSDPNYEHLYVLRASATTNLYGDMVVSNPAIGATFEKDYSINILPDWTKTVYPVAILWKHDTSGDKPHYKFVNAFKL